MKNLNYLIISLIVLILMDCSLPEIQIPKFPCVIELSAIKVKDIVDSSFHFAIMRYKEENSLVNIYPKIQGIPDSLNNIHKYYVPIDNMQAYFQAYKVGLIKKDDFIRQFNKQINDTIFCSSGYVKTYAVIVTGISKQGKKYYLFDSNNNYDLSDEPLYPLKEKTFTYQPHKILFERVMNNKIQTDSTWIAFYEESKYDLMWMQFCEHTKTSFTLDSVQYELITFPSLGTSVKYGTEVAFKVMENSKDIKQVFGYNQYAHLGNLYYQVSCSNDGRTVRLQMDTAAWKKGSTQLNMPALPFKTLTLKGDTVRFPSDFKVKYVLLDFWSTSCFHCIKDIKNSYLDIYKKYGGGKFEIVGVADNSKNETERFVSQNRITWTMIPAKKSDIQKLYRIEGYPVLYLLNPDGVIISKGQELSQDKIISVLEKYLKPDSQHLQN